LNEKQKEEMGKRLVEILITLGVFKEEDCRACVGGVHTDIHTWITMKETMEKEQFRLRLTDAIRIYEGERLAKAWEKHKKESGT